jgi:hypothetical protein
MLDRIIHEFVGDEDKSPLPWCEYPMGIKYTTYDISENFGLAMICSELDFDVDSFFIRKRALKNRESLFIAPS